MPIVNQHHDSSILEHMRHLGVSGVPTATQQSTAASHFVHHSPHTYVDQHHDSSISEHMHHLGVAGVPTNTQQSVSASTFVHHAPQPFVDPYAAPSAEYLVRGASTGSRICVLIIFATNLLQAAHACHSIGRLRRRPASWFSQLTTLTLSTAQTACFPAGSSEERAIFPSWLVKESRTPGACPRRNTVHSCCWVSFQGEHRLNQE